VKGVWGKTVVITEIDGKKAYRQARGGLIGLDPSLIYNQQKKIKMVNREK